MANYFDQFDAPASAQAPAPTATQNYFDQFDQPAYRGSILPFSTDAQGKPYFDPSAGILGSVIDAVKLPSDVVSGQQPVVGPNGRTDPTLNARAYNFASIASPVEFGSRAPSAADLRNAGVSGYQAFRNSGIDISPTSVANALAGVKQGLENDGIIAELAPKTFAGINKALGDAANTNVVTPANLQALRRTFGNVSGDKTDMLAASRAKQGLDGFLSSLSPGDLLSGSPEDAAAAARTFANANANYAAAQRSNDLTGSLDKANTGFLDQAEARAHASHSGRNIDNSIRQRVASFLQDPSNVAGFSQPEIDALNGVVRGGPVQNTARFVGNFLGGGGGAGGLFASAVGLGLGHHFAGPEGGEFGMLAAPSVGMAAKSLENALARRSLNPVDEMIRMRSPLANITQPALPPLTPSGMVTRALLPGLLDYLRNGPLPPAMPQGGLLAPGA